MKVAILTSFAPVNSTFSSVDVVADHLSMFLDANIMVKLLAFEECPHAHNNEIYSDRRIEWVKTTNVLKVSEHRSADNSSSIQSVDDTFLQLVDNLSNVLKNNLLDIDVCMIYDLLHEERYLGLNLAIKKAQQQLPDVRFIAYSGSGPIYRTAKAGRPFSAIYTPMPNTIYVHHTNAGVLALTREYGIPAARCQVVNHSMDVLAHMSQDVKAISNTIDLLSPDILIIYPARLTPGKRFEKVATFAAAIKNKTAKSVQVVFCDFPATDINPDLYKTLIRRLGRALNLNEGDLIFTSDLGYKNGFPRSSVLDLFTLSNLFVCPSFSESFGLIALEAASRGNFLVLNENVPALEELGNQLHTYFMRWDARNFGSDTKETYHPSEQEYLEEHALRVVNLMQENSVVYAKTMVRKNCSRKWVWENQLAPLLEK